MVKLKQQVYCHDMLYDLDYYHDVREDAASASAASMCESIYSEFKPKRIIDVGCGKGALLEALRNRGCEVLGLDYSEAALRLCRAKHLPVLKFNLEKDVFTEQPLFDVAISMDVGEHLSASSADQYVTLLTRVSTVIVFSAAPPGQGGRVGIDHVNEQPPLYWIAKFDRRGFRHNEALSGILREKWKSAGYIAPCHYQNLMIFTKS